jgi:hypothetical protein
MLTGIVEKPRWWDSGGIYRGVISACWTPRGFWWNPVDQLGTAPWRQYYSVVVFDRRHFLLALFGLSKSEISSQNIGKTKKSGLHVEIGVSTGSLRECQRQALVNRLICRWRRFVKTIPVGSKFQALNPHASERGFDGILLSACGARAVEVRRWGEQKTRKSGDKSEVVGALPPWGPDRVQRHIYGIKSTADALRSQQLAWWPCGNG